MIAEGHRMISLLRNICQPRLGPLPCSLLPPLAPESATQKHCRVQDASQEGRWGWGEKA